MIDMNPPIILKLDEMLKRRYTLRRTGNHGRSIETTLPVELVERYALLHDLPWKDAIDKLGVEVYYGDAIDGLYLRIVEETPTEKGGSE